MLDPISRAPKVLAIVIFEDMLPFFGVEEASYMKGTESMDQITTTVNSISGDF